MAKQSVQSQQEPGIWQKIASGAYNVADYLVGSAIAAMWDVHDKLIDRGWFGGNSFNTMYYQNRRSVGLDQNQKEAVSPEDAKQPVKEAHEHAPDFSPDVFYGRQNSEKTTEPQQARGRDDDLDLGMER